MKKQTNAELIEKDSLKETLRLKNLTLNKKNKEILALKNDLDKANVRIVALLNENLKIQLLEKYKDAYLKLIEKKSLWFKIKRYCNLP